MSRPPKKKGRLASPLSVLSSLRLTVVLLALSMVLIFIATITQVEIGIHEVQLQFFRSWIAWWDPTPLLEELSQLNRFGWVKSLGGHSLPIPGGALLGSLLILNLLAAHGARFKLRWNKAGMLLVHTGILIMLLGEFMTAIFSTESQMRLDENGISNHSISPREIELVVIDTSEPGMETVHAIPYSRLRDGAEFGMGGFDLKVVRFFRNSEIENEAIANEAFDPMRANQGMGAKLAVRNKPRETAMDLRDLSSAFVEIVSKDGKSQGRWLVSNALPGTQEFQAGGKTWKMAIRQKRFYHPFSIRLIDFTHDRYIGTQIPKNFSSRIKLLNPATGENRETLIYMNHPLRYEGLTFYQSGFDNDDKTSILQVVRNPAWTMPYVSCAMVGIGLLWIFSQHLLKAIARRRKTAAA